MSLDTGAHRDRVRELVAPFQAIPDWDKVFVHDFFKDRPGPGGQFRAVVALLCLRLSGLFETIKPLSEGNEWQMILKEWMKPGSLTKESETK